MVTKWLWCPCPSHSVQQGWWCLPDLGQGPLAWPHSRSRPGSIPVPLAQRSSVLISVSCPHLLSLFLPSFSLQPTGSFYKADLIVWLPPFLLTWPCLQTVPLPSVSRALPWGIFPLPHPPSPLPAQGQGRAPLHLGLSPSTPTTFPPCRAGWSWCPSVSGLEPTAVTLVPA